MPYGRPGPRGYASSPFNRFVYVDQDKGDANSTERNGSLSAEKSSFHPKFKSSYHFSARKRSLRPLTGGQEGAPTPTIESELDEKLIQNNFSFTPDFPYYRYLDADEHKGRGEGSTTTSFCLPQFSALRSLDLRKHTESVRTVAWNTTGQYFASGSVDKLAIVWELDSLNQIRFHKELKGHTGSIDQLCWDPKTPNRLATASSDKTVRVWNAQTGDLLHLIKTPGENINICWSPDGQYLAVGNKGAQICFIDVGKSQIFKEYKHTAATNEMMWNHSGKFFLLSTASGTVVFLEFPALSHAFTLPAHTASCFCIDLDPHGRFLATGGADGKVSIWCLKTMVCLGTYSNLSSPVRALSFSYDGQFLASASEDDAIDICDSYTGASLHRVECSKPVNSLAWHPIRHLLGFSADDFRSHEDGRGLHGTQYQVKVFGV